jgi:hypothetical protein
MLEMSSIEIFQNMIPKDPIYFCLASDVADHSQFTPVWLLLKLQETHPVQCRDHHKVSVDLITARRVSLIHRVRQCQKFNPISCMVCSESRILMVI